MRPRIQKKIVSPSVLWFFLLAFCVCASWACVCVFIYFFSFLFFYKYLFSYLPFLVAFFLALFSSMYLTYETNIYIHVRSYMHCGVCHMCKLFCVFESWAVWSPHVCVFVFVLVSVDDAYWIFNLEKFNFRIYLIVEITKKRFQPGKNHNVCNEMTKKFYFCFISRMIGVFFLMLYVSMCLRNLNFKKINTKWRRETKTDHKSIIPILI